MAEAESSAELNSPIREGKAIVFEERSIFYNPVQEFNRDMSVVALTVFAEEMKNFRTKKPIKRRHKDESKQDGASEEAKSSPVQEAGITVVEALAASGLRSIRYALEVPNVEKIIANDFSLYAVQAINRNIKENKVEPLIEVQNHDAVWLMQKLHFENKSIHVVDLDPYGCPTRFLDSAINCIADGGMLMVTCTDMAVIASKNPETCFAKYGALSMRSCACHEMALRIALQSVAVTCAKYGKYIVPMLSFSADFYIRIFVRIFSGQKMCKSTSSKLSLVFQCPGCEMTTLQPLGIVKELANGNMLYQRPTGPPVSSSCEHCKSTKHRIGGPIWNDKMHDEEFVSKMIEVAQKSELNTHKRMIGMLTMIKEELSDVPLYYTVDLLASKVHCSTLPSALFKSAILNAGFRVSSSHCVPNSIKTDAPQNFIWDVLRAWIKKHPIAEKRLKENNVVANILSKEPEYQVDFKRREDATPYSTLSGLLRYQPNPKPFWGPGARNRFNLTGVEKKLKNQGKNKYLKIPVVPEIEKETPPEGDNKME